MKKATIGLVDDHQLFLKSLVLMLESFKNYEVVIEALNGKDLQEKLTAKTIVPDIMLIDVSMPVMNGIETAQWLSTNYPAMKLVALSMNNDEYAVIAMLKAGCCAYLLKDAHPNELENALKEIIEKGFYNSDASNINFRKLLANQVNEKPLLNEKEKEFLGLACSDLTYKQIAGLMKVSERAVDNYRENLFEKLNVQSRVGMALEAIIKGLVIL